MKKTVLYLRHPNIIHKDPALGLRAFFVVRSLQTDYSGRAVWGMNCLRPLEHWEREFAST
jgi:hypothetical protein